MLSIKDVKIRSKLILIDCILLVPILVLSYLFVSDYIEQINFADKELKGAAYLGSVMPLTYAVMAEASGAQTTGKKTPGNQTPGRQAETTAFLNDRSTYDFRLGTGRDSEAFAASLAALQTSQPADGGAGVDPALTETAIGKGRALIASISDTSNMTLDNDLSSYYVMYALTVKLPKEANHLRQVLAYIRSQPQKGGVTDEEHWMLMSDTKELLDISGDLNTSLRSAYKNDASGELHKNLGPANLRFVQALQGFTDQATVSVEALHHGGTLDRAALQTKGLDALAAITQLSEAGNHEFTRSLKTRIHESWVKLWVLVGLVGAITGTACLMTVVIARHISDSLASMIAALTRLTRDDFDVKIEGADRRDELGIMARTVDVLRNSLVTAEQRRQAATLHLDDF